MEGADVNAETFLNGKLLVCLTACHSVRTFKTLKMCVKTEVHGCTGNLDPFLWVIQAWFIIDVEQGKAHGQTTQFPRRNSKTLALFRLCSNEQSIICCQWHSLSVHICWHTSLRAGCLTPGAPPGPSKGMGIAQNCEIDLSVLRRTEYQRLSSVIFFCFKWLLHLPFRWSFSEINWILSQIQKLVDEVPAQSIVRYLILRASHNAHARAGETTWRRKFSPSTFAHSIWVHIRSMPLKLDVNTLFPRGVRWGRKGIEAARQSPLRWASSEPLSVVARYALLFSLAFVCGVEYALQFTDSAM